VPQLTPVKILLAQPSTHHIEEALSNLAQLEEYIRALNRKTIYIDVLALQALAYEAQENWQKAAEKLAMALRLAQPGGFIRNFVDLGPPMASLMSRLQKQNNTAMGSYISQILTAFPIENQSLPGPALNNVLSRRELQTLKLLDTDLSPEDIAVQMTISPATVRTHTRNIYTKLKVNGRFEAVYRAKELGLIESI
jgi:LuxR family maltose regulon positive regulatory protein